MINSLRNRLMMEVLLILETMILRRHILKMMMQLQTLKKLREDTILTKNPTKTNRMMMAKTSKMTNRMTAVTHLLHSLATM